jgi:hypothetical protein
MQVSNGNLRVAERVWYVLCLMNFSKLTFVMLIQAIAELARPCLEV